MAELKEAIRGAAERSKSLRETIAQTAESERAAAKRQALEGSRRKRDQLRRRETRMSGALAGLKAIQRLAAASETQELLALRGSIILYSKSEAFSDSALSLAKDGIEISSLQYGIEWGHNESITGRGSLDAMTSYRLSFGYDVDDGLILSRKLARVFSTKKLVLRLRGDEDEDDLQEIRTELSHATDEEMFTQILVDCADPGNLEHYVRQAI